MNTRNKLITLEGAFVIALAAITVAFAVGLCIGHRQACHGDCNWDTCKELHLHTEGGAK